METLEPVREIDANIGQLRRGGPSFPTLLPGRAQRRTWSSHSPAFRVAAAVALLSAACAAFPGAAAGLPSTISFAPLSIGQDTVLGTNHEDTNNNNNNNNNNNYYAWNGTLSVSAPVFCGTQASTASAVDAELAGETAVAGSSPGSVLCSASIPFNLTATLAQPCAYDGTPSCGLGDPDSVTTSIPSQAYASGHGTPASYENGGLFPYASRRTFDPAWASQGSSAAQDTPSSSSSFSSAEGFADYPFATHATEFSARLGAKRGGVPEAMYFGAVPWVPPTSCDPFDSSITAAGCENPVEGWTRDRPIPCIVRAWSYSWPNGSTSGLPAAGGLHVDAPWARDRAEETPAGSFGDPAPFFDGSSDPSSATSYDAGLTAGIDGVAEPAGAVQAYFAPSAADGGAHIAVLGELRVFATRGSLTPGAVVTVSIEAPFNASFSARGDVRLLLCGASVPCNPSSSSDNGGGGGGSSGTAVTLGLTSLNVAELSSVQSQSSAPLSSLSVSTLDASGNPVAQGSPSEMRNATVYVLSASCAGGASEATVAASVGAPTASSVLSSYTVSVTDGSVSVVTGVTLGPAPPVAGSGYSIVVRDNTGSLAGTCLGITVIPGDAFMVSPTAAALSTDVVAAAVAAVPGFSVRVTDEAGNTVSSDTGTREIAVTCVPPEGLVPPLETCEISVASTQTVVNGAGNIIGVTMTAPRAVAGYKLALSSSSLPGVGNVTLTVTEGAPHGLASLSSALYVPTSASASIPAFDVIVVDAAGNSLEGIDANIVRILLVTGSSSTLGLNSYTSPILATEGRTSLSATALTGIPQRGSYTLTLAASGLVSATVTVNVTAGQIAYFGLESSNILASAGASVGLTAVRVLGFDASGGRVGAGHSESTAPALESRTVVASILSTPAGSGTTLTGTTSVAIGADGSATFSSLVLQRAREGNVTIAFAEANGLATAADPALTVIVSSGLPVSLSMAMPSVPSGILAATWPLVLPAVEVTGIDLNGAPSFAGEPGTRTLTASVLETPSSLSSSAFETSPTAPTAVMAAGKATLVGLTLARVKHGQYKVLVSSADGLLNGTFAFSVSSGPASMLFVELLNENLFPLVRPYRLSSAAPTAIPTAMIRSLDASSEPVPTPAGVNVTASVYLVGASDKSIEPASGDPAQRRLLSFTSASPGQAEGAPETVVMPTLGTLLWPGILFNSPPHGDYILAFTAGAGSGISAGSAIITIVAGVASKIVPLSPSFTIVSAGTVDLGDVSVAITDASGSQVTSSGVTVTLASPLVSAADPAANGTTSTSTSTSNAEPVLDIACKDGTVACLTATTFRGAATFSGLRVLRPPAGSQHFIASSSGVANGDVPFTVNAGEAEALGAVAEGLNPDGSAVPRPADKTVPVGKVTINAEDAGGNKAVVDGQVIIANLTRKVSATMRMARRLPARLGARGSGTELGDSRPGGEGAAVADGANAAADADADADSHFGELVAELSRMGLFLEDASARGAGAEDGPGVGALDDEVARERSAGRLVLAGALTEAMRLSPGRTVVSQTAGATALASSSAGTFTACGTTLTGTTSKVISGGSAVFDDLALSDPCLGDYDVSFFSGSLAVSSVPVSVSVGAPFAVGIREQPPSIVRAGVSLNPSPVADIRDSYDNPIVLSGIEVTVRFFQAGARLTNGETANVVITNGIGLARFPGLLGVGTPGQSYNLRFGADGLLPAVSGNMTFDPCPVHMTPQGTTCVCDPGYFGEAGSTCSPCPVGRYQPTQGQTTCQACPANMITFDSAIAATTEDLCSCREGFFEIAKVSEFARGGSGSGSDGNGTDLSANATSSSGANATVAAAGIPLPDVRACSECPDNAICEGGGHIAPRPGFWRINNASLAIIECRREDACRGGFNSECGVGFEGRLCTSCEEGFGKLGTACTECPNRAWSIFVFILTILFVISLVSFLSYSAQSLTKRRGAGIQKVFLNYIQITALLGSFKLDFPSSLRSLLSFAQGAGMLSVRIPTIDCAFDMSYFDEFRAHLILPVLGLGAMAIVVLSVALFRHFRPRILEDGLPENHAEVRDRLFSASVATFFVIVFLTHPLITKECLQVFSCESLGDSREFLTVDLSVECTGADYNSTIGLSIVVILAYVLAMPALMLSVLRHHRFDLAEDIVRQRIQILYEGFRADRYYWEMVIVARKVLMVAIIVFVDSPLKQAYTGLILIMAAIMLHTYFHPFLTTKLHMFELLSLLCSYATLMLALIYQSYVADDADFPESAGATAFAVALIMLNSAMALFFAYEIARRQRVVLQFTVNVLKRVGMQIDYDPDAEDDDEFYDDQFQSRAARKVTNPPAAKDVVATPIKGRAALDVLEERFRSTPGDAELASIDDILGSDEDSGAGGGGVRGGVRRGGRSNAPHPLLGGRFRDDLAESTMGSIHEDDEDGRSGDDDDASPTPRTLPPVLPPSGGATTATPMFQMVDSPADASEQPMRAMKHNNSGSAGSASSGAWGNKPTGRYGSSSSGTLVHPVRPAASAPVFANPTGPASRARTGGDFSLDPSAMAGTRSRRLSVVPDGDGADDRGPRSHEDVSKAMELARQVDPSVLREAASLSRHVSREDEAPQSLPELPRLSSMPRHARGMSRTQREPSNSST